MTRASEFKAEQLRAAHGKKPKQPKRRRDTPVDTSLPGVSATDRKAGAGHTAPRNRKARAKQGAQLEDSATGKPSRKSTRGSQGRVKRTTNLQVRQINRTRSPKARALRGD